MSGIDDTAVPSDGQGHETERVRIECKADRRIHELDVEWMKGAIFEFDAMDEAEEWIAEQNLKVPGRLFLADAPDSEDQLPVDYYLKYTRPD